VLGAQMGVDLNILPHLITGPVEAMIRAIVRLIRKSYAIACREGRPAKAGLKS
jgi:hypothetical protein